MDVGEREREDGVRGARDGDRHRCGSGDNVPREPAQHRLVLSVTERKFGKNVNNI